MKNVLVLIAGIGIGFVLAHQLNKTPEGRQLFESVTGGAKQFRSSLVDGYKTREAELRSASGDVQGDPRAE
jgi:hypothetical protein